MLCYGVLTFVSIIGVSFSLQIPQNILRPCKKTDLECQTTSAKYAMRYISEVSPDPVSVDLIEGSLPGLSFTFSNVSIFGKAHCDIDSVNLDYNKKHLSFVLTCKNYALWGDYILNGTILSRTILDNGGRFKIFGTKYLIQIDASLVEDKTSSPDRVTLRVKNYDVKPKAEDRVIYYFTNKSSSREDEDITKLANDNWEEMTTILQDPFVQTIASKFVKGLNELLESTPVSQLFLD